jgi:hypothetical protein
MSKDIRTTMQNLDRWANLNIDMDAKAKQNMEIAKRAQRHYTIVSEPWSMWAHSQKKIC